LNVHDNSLKSGVASTFEIVELDASHKPPERARDMRSSYRSPDGAQRNPGNCCLGPNPLIDIRTGKTMLSSNYNDGQPFN
jgi:hypothetical protein